MFKRSPLALRNFLTCIDKMDSSKVSKLNIIQESSDAEAKDLDRPMYYAPEVKGPRPLVRDPKVETIGKGPRPLVRDLRGQRPLVRGPRPLVRGTRPLVRGPEALGGLIMEASQVIVNTRLQIRAGCRPSPTMTTKS